MMETRSKRSKARHTDWLFLAFHPLYWRTGTRRLFLMTAPVAIPLWACGVSVLLVRAILREPAAMALKLWNAKPRRRYSYTDYEYGRSRPTAAEEASRTSPIPEGAPPRLRVVPPAEDATMPFRWGALTPEPAEHRVDRVTARAKRSEQQPEQGQAGRRERAANAEFGIDHSYRHREVHRAN